MSDVIDPAIYTRESVQSFLRANAVPLKDAKYEPVIYDGAAKEIHWTRYVRDDSGRLVLSADEVATERMVTAVKAGQEPKYHLALRL